MLDALHPLSVEAGRRRVRPGRDRARDRRRDPDGRAAGADGLLDPARARAVRGDRRGRRDARPGLGHGHPGARPPGDATPPEPSLPEAGRRVLPRRAPQRARDARPRGSASWWSPAAAAGSAGCDVARGATVLVPYGAGEVRGERRRDRDPVPAAGAGRTGGRLVTLLLGLDVGTTSTKAAVIDLDGHELAHGRAPMPWTTVPTGAQIAPEALLECARQAAAEALRQAGPVAAVGVSSMAETGILLDEAGRPSGAPAIAWHDSRGKDEAERIASELEDFAATTGLPPTELCSLAKLRWLRDHDPAAARRRALAQRGRVHRQGPRRRGDRRALAGQPHRLAGPRLQDVVARGPGLGRRPRGLPPPAGGRRHSRRRGHGARAPGCPGRRARRRRARPPERRGRRGRGRRGRRARLLRHRRGVHPRDRAARRARRSPRPSPGA